MSCLLQFASLINYYQAMSTELLDSFNARGGIVCCVGAGGKKTTMYRLAAEHAGRVGITATAHIEYFPRTLPATKYIAPEDELLRDIEADESSRIIAFAQPSQRRGRRAGIAPQSVQQFKQAGRFDLLLIKADGARSRLLKAPAEHEPPIPACTDTVIAVISAKAIGQRLTDKVAHRVEHITTITGLEENGKIQPVDIARILASKQGALKNTGNARVIPLINMVDDSEREILARTAAQEALSMTGRFDYVVLAAMRNASPIVDVISRQYRNPAI